MRQLAEERRQCSYGEHVSLIVAGHCQCRVFRFVLESSGAQRWIRQADGFEPMGISARDDGWAVMITGDGTP